MRWLLALLLLLALPRAAFGLEIPELAARTKASVVLVTIYDASGEKLGTGSGFFVSADGRVVTNHHVIRDAVKARATLADKSEVDVVGVLIEDEQRDIAILQTAARDVPPLVLGDSRGLQVGEEIVVIGSPLGLSTTVSAGIVSAVREKGIKASPKRRLELDEDDEPNVDAWGLQITAAISPGSSGSPILSKAGEVVGVAVGTRSDGQNLNFGVPIEVTKELLAKIDPTAVPKPFVVAAKEIGASKGSQDWKNLAISAAVFAGIALAFAVASWIGTMRTKRRSSQSWSRLRGR